MRPLVVNKLVVVADVPVAFAKVISWNDPEPCTVSVDASVNDPPDPVVNDKFVDEAVVAKAFVLVVFAITPLTAVNVEIAPVAALMVDPEAVVNPNHEVEVPLVNERLETVPLVIVPFVITPFVANKFVVVADVPVAAVNVNACRAVEPWTVRAPVDVPPAKEMA